MGGRNFFLTGLIIFSLLFTSLPADAVPITQTFGGQLQSASSPNSYGLTPGAISWTITYDNAITSGEQLVTSFDFRLPSNDHYSLDDFPTAGKPRVRFDGTDIISLSLSSLNFADDGSGLPTLSSDDMSEAFTLTGADGFIGSGTLDFTRVPWPATIWLVGPGLACLAVLRKRIKQA